MTQEEKQLLLQDLSGRFPHGVWISCPSLKREFVFDRIDRDRTENSWYLNGICEIDDCKPYLRPMESMTEEEREEWFKQSHVEYDCEFHTEPTLSLCNCHLSTDWLDKKMFDYRGLIPMGLALPAEEGMYNKMEE